MAEPEDDIPLEAPQPQQPGALRRVWNRIKSAIMPTLTWGVVGGAVGGVLGATGVIEGGASSGLMLGGGLGAAAGATKGLVFPSVPADQESLSPTQAATGRAPESQAMGQQPQVEVPRTPARPRQARGK